ncbi:YybH family protein [Streptomyces sp. NPDC056049]|uniref:YybH family protein n=1 Tax=Streptomyces sp. NPDC056049 TaxID=3345693 RepID=UPI0035DCE533
MSTIPRALPTRPEDVPAAFAARFNSGDPSALAELYEEGAVLAAGPGGAPLAGTALHAANARLQELGVPITVCPRQVYVTGDLALLLVDWRIEGTGSDGRPVSVGGTATDVARRGEDGRWRYAVDNPFGTAPAGLPEGEEESPRPSPGRHAL